MAVVAVVIGVFGAFGVLRAADQRVASVQRITGLGGVLAPLDDDDPDNDANPPETMVSVDASGNTIVTEIPRVTYRAENYLLVGSDSREGVDANADDSEFIGDTSDVGGRRSDTIMVLRQERNGGAALMSVPRDLWVPIAGTGQSQRVNTAFNEGPVQLVQTVSEALNIPIHHYVEVDFQGFKDIIDEIGGVEVCVGYAARDTHSGLSIPAGCSTLDGSMALAFARSRYYQQSVDGRWETDGRADLGRIERQQLFMRAAVDGALRRLRAEPFSSGGTLGAVIDAVKIDDALDPLKAAQALRQAAEEGLRTFALPVYNDRVGSAAVLRLGEDADELLAYFRGETAAPESFETTETTSGS